MPSLSEQRKARIREGVDYGKRFKRGYILLQGKLREFFREKHPTLTEKTIRDYAVTAQKMIESSYSQEMRAPE